MKDKICVVTWYNSPNYGTQLQATALCRYFEKKGYDVSILKSFRVKSYMIKHPRLMITRFREFLNKKNQKKFFHPVPYEITTERRARIDEYVDSVFNPLSITSMDVWQKVIDDETIFVSGSDIIWQPALGAPGKFFLDFAMYENLKRFSYASSTGTKSMPEKFYSDYKCIMNGFSSIGVRENNTAVFFEKLLGKKVQKVLDPTLLFDKEFWDEIESSAKSYEIQNSKYICCYFVMDDERYWNYLNLIRLNYPDYKIVVIPMHKSDEEKGDYAVLDGTPREFISLIKNSEFVVTDSFHASIFSFIYSKEFYILKRTRSDEDEKFSDLLNRYYLNSRVIIDESKFERDENTDYSSGRNQLENDRILSYKFIDDALNK